MDKTVIVESGFKSDWKKLQKKHYSYDVMDIVIQILVAGKALPGKYKDHALSGNWKGYRECHIESNWLLIYIETETDVVLIATGTHDDLFK